MEKREKERTNIGKYVLNSEMKGEGEEGKILACSISSEFRSQLVSFEICKFVSIHRADGELLFRGIARKTSPKVHP